MILFYSEHCDGKTAYLQDSEAIHCKQALRKNIGDTITLTDGKGAAYSGTIVSMSKRSVEVSSLEPLQLSKPRDYKIHIGIAPTKNISRFEWFLEKATELGIDEVTPLLCSRSERKVIKPERLNKILVSAMKQSLKSNLPTLNPMTKFVDFVKSNTYETHFIAHLEEDPKLLIHQYEPMENACILIGPEGDFTLEEIQFSLTHGYQSVSLGDYRLRTETAAISAVQAIHFANQMA
jgi:16S rRNA (uracil1498-N3)-methyltransferase